MSYYVFPQGTPSHTVKLYARSDDIMVEPFMPSGHDIEWRIDGTIIPNKVGNTSDIFVLSINSKQGSDFELSSADAGATIDFVIDGTIFSNPVVITNSLPILTETGPLSDSFGFMLPKPTIYWTYFDPDGGNQVFYRVAIGTTLGGTNIYDTGDVVGQDSSYAFPSLLAALNRGQRYYWTVDVGDGSLIDETNPMSGYARTTVTGSSVVNNLPIATNIKINGANDAIETLAKPIVTWSLVDADGQPQRGFRVVFARDSILSDIIWDTGLVPGDRTSVIYNNNNVGPELPSHTLIYVGVQLEDSLEVGSFATVSFTRSSPPILTTVTINSLVNPTNLITQIPTFNWEYTDSDGDPLTAFEIRVSAHSEFLGTDSFSGGDIWNTGVVSSPTPYSAVFNFDGRAWPLPNPDRKFAVGQMYFFQIQVRDQYEISDWLSGTFRMNEPASATNVRVLPVAPYHNENLLAAYDFVSVYGSESPDTQIKWFENGIEVISLRNKKFVPNSMLVPGHVWNFTIRPSDGVQFGNSVTSSSATILNRAPQIINPVILPIIPVASDQLVANFEAFDAEGDIVSVNISWYKNNIEQEIFRNSNRIPPYVVGVGESWRFVAVPSDNYSLGNPVNSSAVIISNTKPEIKGIFVEGEVSPSKLKNFNPTVAWTYTDSDSQAQARYQVVIGSSPLKIDGHQKKRTKRDGIIYRTPSNGVLLAGDEVFNSGQLVGDANSLRYSTPDNLLKTTFSSSDFTVFKNYIPDNNSGIMYLRNGTSDGTASLKFNGASTLYEMSLNYEKENAPATFNILVDGILVGTITSSTGSGSTSKIVGSVRLQKDATISVTGIANSSSRAKFRGLSITPVLQFDIDASSFDVLSGYVSDGDAGIKLSGLVGTASTKFPFSSGVYDIELTYVTETTGSPSLSLSINNSVISSFSFETGAKVRSKTISGVSLSKGDSIKFIGSKNLGAAARIKKLTFKPKSTIATGSKLLPGEKYYLSIRAHDGIDWSDWYTSSFSTDGSAWNNVSNKLGWTVDFGLIVT